MTNKEKLQKIIEQDINPTNNYNEIIKIIEIGEQMKNKKNLLKWSLVPICLAVVISGVLFLNNKNGGNNLLEDKPYIDKENNVTLNINDMSNLGILRLDVDIKVENGVNIPYPFKVDENKQEKITIPEDLTQSKNYVVYTKKDKESNKYDVISNYIMIITNGNDRNIEIKYSKEHKPSRDYYFSEDGTKTTTINGIDLKIYKYEERFYTSFKYNDYNFDIETSNITEKEFSNYLVSILK